jgi:hypothetical protein
MPLVGAACRLLGCSFGGRPNAPSSRTTRCVVVGALLFAPGLLGAARAESQQEELRRLRQAVESMQKTVDEQKRKIHEIEEAQGMTPAVPPPATAPLADTTEPASPVTHRPALSDEQIPAPRPGNLAVDPKMLGFVSIPSTPVLIKLNAKPRVDFTYDPKNTGDDDRFVPAKIPVTGDPARGGGPIANVNSKGSRLSVDVRAPGVDGSPRFYFENDFFGSGSDEFNFRVRHIYGKIYNVTVGETFGVLENPDIWPDTVDYKGPNSMVYARVPLVHYQLRLGDAWVLKLGIEQPQSVPSDIVASTGSITPADVGSVTGVNHAPDGGFNLRWEDARVGHTQFGAIFRDIGARSATLGDHEALGWGTNLSTVFDVLAGDSILAQATYGYGIGSLGSDTNKFKTDAAFDSHGDLVTLPYVGAFAGYTHKWTDDWRSTATYGFVNLEPQASQGPDAYRRTQYASVNVIRQLRKRLSVGVEVLYGHKETQDHAKGDVVRTQVGVVYSIF